MLGVVVTNLDLNLDDEKFKVTKDMGIDESLNCDTLIFHSCEEDFLTCVMRINELKSRFNKFIYINSTLNPLLTCIFRGLDGDIYDVDDYLYDNDTLEFLVSDYKATGMEVKTSKNDIESLGKCINTLLNSDEKGVGNLIKNGTWVKTLSESINSIDMSVSKEKVNNEFLLDFISRVSELNKSFEGYKSNAEKEIANLNEIIETKEKTERPNAPFVYSTLRVPTTVRKVLFIKSMGQCKYLNSFVLAYQNYLRMTKQISSKILLVYPKQKVYMAKFSQMSRLEQDSLGVIDLSKSNIYVTFEPKKMVLDTFFGQSNIGLFIVVDMTYQDDIIEGMTVEKYNAVGSLSEVDIFNLPRERTLSSIHARVGMLKIPHINNYVRANDSERVSLYFKACSEVYKQLDDVLLGR